MKTKSIFIVLGILSCFAILYLQYGRKPVLNHSLTQTNGAGYKAVLSVTANKLVILDQERLAQDLLEHVQNNDFPNMELSYDLLGSPSEIDMVVYTNSLSYRLNLPAFHIIYPN